MSKGRVEVEGVVAMCCHDAIALEIVVQLGEALARKAERQQLRSSKASRTFR